MLKKHDIAVLVSPIATDLPDFKDVDWIGVDFGFQVLLEHNIQPYFVIGDFDSKNEEIKLDCPVFIHPTHKDETDMELALMKAKEMGYSQIYICGAIGKRLDHTLANLRIIGWQYPNVVVLDQNTRIRVLTKGQYEFKAQYSHISFFALEKTCISLDHFEYELDQRWIDVQDIYTCSNSIPNESATVTVHEGRVISVETNFR
ncbi:thiamine diphosphokinase [Allobaculum stercoricanis]|uniref:thiamine diphosphokinase n=1 Tax=Allobaculum stercoricanis TaxID=174709 RepID=UPI00037FC8B7|nr:thiamine diphosphokinase [Allobaculum stercoricanis]